MIARERGVSTFRLRERARGAAKSGRKMLAPYLCAGYPSPDLTLPLLRALAEAGADCIELGVPFSDPLADGGSIQRASQCALAGGMTLEVALEIAARFTAEDPTPLILMTYVNPLLRAGGPAAVERAADAGCAACIVPDLPPEESARLASSDGRLALPLIPLIAPNTPDARLSEVAAADPPFLYAVSILGVTGARDTVGAQTTLFLARAWARTGVPLLVGFGIKGPDQAARLAALSEGVIVGSALVDHLHAQPEGADLPAAAGEFMRPMRAAVDGVRSGSRVAADDGAPAAAAEGVPSAASQAAEGGSPC